MSLASAVALRHKTGGSGFDSC